jgi:hypothetical protein
MLHVLLLHNGTMTKLFTKFTLCSFFVASWVLSVPALHLGPRAPSHHLVCNGLAKMRVVQGSGLCTNKNNAFNYQPGSLTLIKGPVSGGPGFRCGKESNMPALLKLCSLHNPF